MIEKKDIEKLREQVSLVDLVQDNDTQLVASGRVLKGLCPLPGHDEKTPSFTVDPEKNRYVCYGCGAHGDVIEFIKETQGLSFIETLRYLAQREGIQLKETETTDHKSNAPIADINLAASEYYRSQMNSEVTTFCAERNLPEEYLREEWGVGFSTPRGLLPYLKKKGYQEHHIIEAGLARKSDRGQVYEVFSNRLMWTIVDHLGRVAGFGARKLFPNDPLAGKFINTSATELYRKNDILFALDKARVGIRKDHVAILCEGYTDVVVFHMSDLPYAVAACGTAITENHIRRLARILGTGGELVVSLDGDAAGVKAATKLVDLVSSYPLTMTCILVPNNMDPEEYHREHGEQGIRELFESRKPLIETLLEHILEKYNLQSPEEVNQAMQEAGEVLSKIHNEVLRIRYDQWLASKLRVKTSSISSSYQMASSASTKSVEESRNLELDVLRMAYQYPSSFKKYREEICEDEDLYTNEELKDAIQNLVWLDDDVDDALWRGEMDEEIPKLRETMRTGLPVKIIDSDRAADKYMKELYERLKEDKEHRNAQIQLHDLTQKASDSITLFKLLQEQN